jgi:hypothetical protein
MSRRTPETLWQPVRWHGWEARAAVSGDCEIIVGHSSGPRVLSLRRSGRENLLHRDMTGFGVDEWRMHGGHRFTTAPESAASYAPDNAPCRVWQEGAWLYAESAAPGDGLRRTLAVAPEADGGFSLRHILENAGAQPWCGALWAITCVPRGGCIVSPCGQDARLWENSAPLWTREGGGIVTRPDGRRGKAGWHSAAGWLEHRRADGVIFQVRAAEIPLPAQCVDGGCNVEVFCEADYMEMETLSAALTLAPGARAAHTQHWSIIHPSKNPPC